MRHISMSTQQRHCPECAPTWLLPSARANLAAVPSRHKTRPRDRIAGDRNGDNNRDRGGDGAGADATLMVAVVTRQTHTNAEVASRFTMLLHDDADDAAADTGNADMCQYRTDMLNNRWPICHNKVGNASASG
jgi:hypothetical protein